MWLNCSEDLATLSQASSDRWGFLDILSSDIEDIINNFYFGAGSNIFLRI